ncbi:Ig-like domain-containing protein [Pseudomonas denitrificans (nom. rej.)]|nr:Ig-like domain-containing protein [Pseudomonas denitrificans (nom. rej.)]
MAIEVISLVAVTESAAQKVAVKVGGKVKARTGTKYLLQVDGSNVAPENVTVKRVGDDVQVFFEGSEDPDLTIRDFFADGMDSQLYGVAEDGQLYAYVRTDGEGFYGKLLMGEGESAPIALGGDSLADGGPYLASSFDDAAGFVVWPWVAGLAGVGAGGAAANRWKDDGKNVNVPKKTASAAPSDIVVMDDIGPIQGPLSSGAITDDSRPEISGSGASGAIIRIFDNGREIGTVTVKPDGTWSFTPELVDGAHSLEVTQEIPGQSSSDPVKVIDLIVDTAAPSAPEAQLDPESDTGEKGDGVTSESTPTIVGKTEPGAEVSVYFPSGEVVNTTADERGDWSVTPTRPLPEGNSDITIVATDPAGNESEPTIITVVVDSTKPDAPQAQLDPESDTGAKGDGITSESTPTIIGKTEPGAEVSVLFPSGEVVNTTADERGDWSVTPTRPLPDGDNDITIVATDPAGNESEPTVITVVVDTKAPDAPDAWLDAASDTGTKGDNITSDNTPTINGKSEPGVEVAVSFPTGEVVTTTADEHGNWSVTPTQPLPEGSNAIEVTATDSAGNQSESTVIDVEIDSVAPDPAQLSITGVTDNVGQITGKIDNGGDTDDQRPVISGTGTAGDTVIVYTKDANGNHEIGRAVVDNQGNWSVRPALPLHAGVNELTAVEMDPAGNQTLPSTPYNITVITEVPAPPSISGVFDDVGPITGSLQKKDVTDDNKPTFEGTAKAGSTIKLYDGDGTLIGSGTADDKGLWRITTDVLTDGLHEITATATNSVGQVSEPTGIWDFTVDTTAPSNVGKLVITDDVGAETGPLQSGSITDDNQPTFSGEAEPGSKVIIYNKETPIGTAIVGQDGKWEFTPGTALPDGKHEFQTEVVDPAGNSSGKGEVTHITVDTKDVEIQILRVIDDQGSLTGPITNGMTDDARPEIQGTGKVGAIVTVFDGSKALGSTTVKADGSWSFTPSSDLSDGEYSITAKALDQTGNTAVSNEVHFTIDTVAPTKPSIDAAQDDVGAIKGEIANPGVTDDSTPTLSGKAEAGAIVTIYDNGEKLGSVIANTEGEWSYTPSTPISEGEHKFVVDATDKAGNTSGKSDEFVITTDYSAPSAPTIDGINDDVGVITGNIVSGGVTDDKRPELSGTAEANAKVTIYDNGTKLGEVTAGQDGKWSFTPSTDLDDGEHSFTVQARDAAGNTGAASAPYPIVINSLPPPPPVIVEVFDDVGLVTGDIGKGGTTDDTLPELKGTAEADSTVTIYANGTKVGEVQADTSGKWSYQLTVELSSGTHVFTADSRGANGLTSDLSASYQIGVDMIPPAAPSIDRVIDNAGALTGELENGEVTDDSTPTFEGMAEAYATVEIWSLMNDSLIGTTKADADGNWSFTPSAPMAEGWDLVYAIAIDTVGNRSEASMEWEIEIEPLMVLRGATSAVDDASSVQAALEPVAGQEHAVATRLDAFYGANGVNDYTKSSDAAESLASASNQEISGGTAEQSLAMVGYDQAIDQATESSNGKIGDLNLSLSSVLDDGKADLFREADSGAEQAMVQNGSSDAALLDQLSDDKGTAIWSAQDAVAGDNSFESYQHPGVDAALLIEQSVQANLV